MEDVRRVWHISLALFVFAGLFLLTNLETRRDFAQALKIGGLITTALIALVGLLAIAAWQSWFIIFHEVFFTQGSWTFANTDKLIRLFPEKFWFDAALTVSGIVLVGGLFVAWVGRWMIVHSSTIQDQLLAKPSWKH